METSKRRLSTLQRHLTTNSTLPFNPKQVLEKYNFERDARLNNRPEGVAQYQHISELAEKDERFNSMLIDPWTNIEPRETKHDHVEVAIIGAGYGGLLAGAHLVKQGIPSSSIRIIDTAGDYTVKSATCLDPISTDATGHWAAKFLPSSNDVFLKSTRPLVYTGPGACKKYQVVLKAVAGNANGECTAIIDVKNANDPPAWNPNMVFDLATPEKSIAGAPVTMGCDAYLSNFAECDLLGTVAPNANFDLVTDPDAGQDVLFEIVKPTSNGGEYPSFNYGGTTALRSDEIFGVSGCT